MAKLYYMEKRGSGLTRICHETQALEGYKDKLKPKFKSTPIQFQITIFAFSDTPNDGDVSEMKLTERQQKILNFIEESPTTRAGKVCIALPALTVSRPRLYEDIKFMLVPALPASHGGSCRPKSSVSVRQCSVRGAVGE